MPLIVLILAICVFAIVYNAVSYTIRALYNYPKLKQEVKTKAGIIKSNNYKIQALQRQLATMEEIMKSKKPFSLVSSLTADALTLVYKESEEFMMYKSRPAYTSAEIVSQLRGKTRTHIAEYKKMLYKYEFIISAFPEIKWYAENDSELLDIAEYISYSELQDGRDRAQDYLSAEEWRNLPDTERNQLALDRYVQKRKKSAWAIGRDYEMACAFVLRRKLYSVEMHGIEKKLSDLGRDLIATRGYRDLSGMYKCDILVIQCKCWGKEREIRENVIMQLVGTTLAYKIQHNYLNSKSVNVIPVLMTPKFSVLSDTAKRFAHILGVRVLVQELAEFPRIKCNINGGNKIYHLPFDQQYDTAQIKNEGEFYAYTVAEAAEKGFRRAFRHNIQR